MNKINIPPIKIKNKIYENQKDFDKRPVIKQVRIVWKSKINPILRGWDIWVKIILLINKINIVIICIISGDSLIKILILEINDKFYSFFLMI